MRILVDIVASLASLTRIRDPSWTHVLVKNLGNVTDYFIILIMTSFQVILQCWHMVTQIHEDAVSQMQSFDPVSVQFAILMRNDAQNPYDQASESTCKQTFITGSSPVRIMPNSWLVCAYWRLGA